MTVTYEVSMITFLIRITVEVMLAGMLDREVGRLCRPERKEPAEARQDSWGSSTSSSCQAAWVLPLLLCNCGANHYDDYLVFLKVIVEAELSIVQDLKDTSERESWRRLSVFSGDFNVQKLTSVELRAKRPDGGREEKWRGSDRVVPEIQDTQERTANKCQRTQLSLHHKFRGLLP